MGLRFDCWLTTLYLEGNLGMSGPLKLVQKEWTVFWRERPARVAEDMNRTVVAHNYESYNTKSSLFGECGRRCE